MTKGENQDLRELIEKVDKIQSALLGDKLENKIGFLDMVLDNQKAILENEKEIVALKEKVKTPWGRYVGVSSLGVGIGGAGASKGGALLAFVKDFFS